MGQGRMQLWVGGLRAGASRGRRSRPRSPGGHPLVRLRPSVSPGGRPSAAHTRHCRSLLVLVVGEGGASM